MAYCPNCAAVLDPTQKFCARCGQPTTAFVPTVPVAAVSDRPSSVKIGTGLIVAAMVVGLSSYFRIVSTPNLYGRLPFEFFLRVFGILGIEIVLIICVWKRQGWARIGLALLLVWAIGNLITSFLRYSGSRDPISYAFPVFLELIRIAALLFLFKPESSAWYKRS